jgi:anaerobic C4-dicarboxylate transporter DcuA
MFGLEFFVVLAMMFIGARYGGVFFGMAGGVGLAILIFVFKLPPSSPPIDVMLIMLSVVVTASALQAAGGMQYLIRLAEYLLRKNPGRITTVAPIVAYVFTFLAGTGNILYNILPVISEVARESGIRPERPVSISVIASQQAITACPISAATVAMVALLAPHGVTLMNILAISIPSTIVGVLVGSLIANRLGKDLCDDPIYLERLRKGLVAPPSTVKEKTLAAGSKEAKLSVALFLLGAVIVVLMGTFPFLRPELVSGGKATLLSMTYTIEIVMLVISAIIVVLCKVDVDAIISGSVFKTGAMGIVTVFGLAWMSDTLIHGNLKEVTTAIQGGIQLYPWLFAFALFGASALMHSQAATVAAVMPLGLALGIPNALLIGMFPAVCGYFLIPSTGVLIAGVAFDLTGTTKIGKYVLNHSYMIPGLVTTSVSAGTGLLIAKMFF